MCVCIVKWAENLIRKRNNGKKQQKQQQQKHTYNNLFNGHVSEKKQEIVQGKSETAYKVFGWHICNYAYVHVNIFTCVRVCDHYLMYFADINFFVLCATFCLAFFARHANSAIFFFFFFLQTKNYTLLCVQILHSMKFTLLQI